ncbi:MAG TPA: LptA/OstA family protein, partial [Terriglobia bacterium]|nr:LptA/OstA family protein [Terriglobia bacterium]
MGTPEFGHQTERRRRRVMRFVAAGFVALVLAIVAYRWKSQRNEKPVVVPKALPSNVSQQLSGYSFTQSDKSGQVFTIHAARTVAFQGDVTVLSDVSVEVFGRTGQQHDLIHTPTCNYNRKTGEVFAEGKVQIELNAPADAKPDQIAGGTEPRLSPQLSGGGSRKGGHIPVYLETSHLSFVKEGSLVVTDAPVSFRAGAATGTAQGLAYATRDDWVELKQNVVVEMNARGGDPSSSGPMRLEATRLRFEKSSGIANLYGPIEITQQGQRISAASGKVHLDDRNRVTAAALEGDVRAHVPLRKSLIEGNAGRVVAEFDPASSLLRSIHAEDRVHVESRDNGRVTQIIAQRLQMEFSGKPARPESGVAEGEVRIISENRSASKPVDRNSGAKAGNLAETKQDLTASAVRFHFAPGGQALRVAETVGPGKMILTSNDPKSGPKIVSANPFLLDFDPRGRPTLMRGLADARMIFKPAPAAHAGTPDAVTTSGKLLATFDPVERTLRGIDQTGDFRFVQGEQRAFSENAHYDAQTETVTLTGHPRLADDLTSARADRILINSNSDTAEGIGHVQTSHLEKSGKTPNPGAGDPTNVVADKMFARQQSQFVHYEGHVRVWHGTDVVQSEAIDVFKDARRVHTDSSVLTTFLEPARDTTQPGTKAAGKQKDRAAPVTISADGLDYSEKARQATYRGHARLETQDATLRSDRMDIFFSPANKSGDSEIERALATGNVTVVQPGRRATGEQAEYFAEGGKIILSGGAPTIYDQEKGFATGRQLT